MVCIYVFESEWVCVHLFVCKFMSVRVWVCVGTFMSVCKRLMFRWRKRRREVEKWEGYEKETTGVLEREEERVFFHAWVCVSQIKNNCPVYRMIQRFFERNYYDSQIDSRTLQACEKILMKFDNIYWLLIGAIHINNHHFFNQAMSLMLRPCIEIVLNWSYLRKSLNIIS